MIGRAFRVLIGFTAACLAAGVTMVLFVYTPAEIATEPTGDRAMEALLLSLAFATQSAMFAAPFALIGAVFAEWQRVGSLLYYAIVAVAIAGIGFLTQSMAETGVKPSIVNGYAATAFAVTGLVSGLVYWLCAGHSAADRDKDGLQEVIPPPASQLQPGGPEGASARVATWKTAS